MSRIQDSINWFIKEAFGECCMCRGSRHIRYIYPTEPLHTAFKLLLWLARYITKNH